MRLTVEVSRITVLSLEGVIDDSICPTRRSSPELADELHPNAEGYKVMGRNTAKVMARIAGGIR